MTPDQLLHSWKRTEGYLRDARAHLSEAAEGICADEISDFDHYVDHNELELALNALEAAFKKRSGESLRVLELMALAAASMGLVERQTQYDERVAISDAPSSACRRPMKALPECSGVFGDSALNVRTTKREAIAAAAIL